MQNQPDIPEYIYRLVADFGRWVEAAIQPGANEGDVFTYGLYEDEIKEQLSVLGWGVVLNDNTARWLPCPPAYFIAQNPPDALYYPQRRYEVPERPDRWEYIWDGSQKVGFSNWEQAYRFLFTHDELIQKDLPLKHYGICSPVACADANYIARTAEQAVQIYLNTCVANNWMTLAQVVRQRVNVYEHCVGLSCYCVACQHLPCKIADPSLAIR